MSSSENEKHVIHGPPNSEIPKVSSYGEFIIDRMKLGGNAEAMINGVTGESMTYNQLLQNSVNLATSLRQLGFGKGDVLCICSENRFEFTITAFAVIYLGGIVTTLNISYTKDEIRHALKLTRPRFAICSPKPGKLFKQISDEVGYVEHFILFDNERVIKALMYNDLVAKHQDISKFKLAKLNSTDDVIAILYSSGTSGMPKGVMLTHKNFIHTIGQVRWMMSSHGHIASETRILSIIPWFHSYGFASNMTYLCLEYKIVFATKFEEKLFLKIIQDHKVNLAFAAPPLILFLAKHSLVDKYDLSSLKELICGAAPLSKELQEATVKRLNLKFVNQGYGMTELTYASMYDVSAGRKAGSSGTLIAGMKSKVIDLDNGKALGSFKEGEICMKGETVMKGYIGMPTATSATFDEDGWFHTGDIGYYDDDNYFYVIDRIKELIKYKGFQVPPAELEALLLTHKGIKDVAVIGLPDIRAGELPLAFVVRQPNSTVTETEIINFVAGKISPAKRLRGGVRFVDEIPKNPSGKILRRYLRGRLKEERSSKL